MQQTENFNLPLIELEDNYDIEVFNEGNRITDTQLKALKDMADSWIAFKNNGGDIGGVITVNDKVNSKYVVSTDQYLRLFTNANDGLIIDEVSKRIIPQTDNKYKLGDSSRNFTDLHLTGVSKATNGYTKLPNGMIMQWGKLVGSVQTVQITLPTSFKVGCVPIVVCSALSTSPSNSNTSVSSVTTSGFTLTKESVSDSVNWIAIGY